MTEVQLKYFVTVAEYGSMTRASKHLYVASSTLSRQIADLEHEVGAELFRREKNEMILTHQGKLCLNEAKKIIRNWERMKQSCRENSSTVYGTLRLGYLDGYAHDVLRRAIAKFAEQYPAVEISLKNRTGKQLHTALAEDALDGVLTISASVKHIPNVRCWPVDSSNELVVAVSAGSAFSLRESLTMKDLHDQKIYICTDDELSADAIMQHLIGCGVRATYEAVPDVETMEILVGADRGVGFTGSTVRICRDTVKLIPIPEAAADSCLVFAHKEGKDIPALELFGQMISRVAAAYK